MKWYRHIYVILSLLLVSACSPETERSFLQILPLLMGTKSQTTSTTITISYTSTSFSLIANQAMTAVSPTITGTITSCSVSPALPTGLILDSLTCAISGTPTILQAATPYTITATDGTSTGSTTISIAVVSTFDIAFTTSAMNGVEAFPNISIPVTIVSTTNATIDYTITGGTATNTADYIFTSGTLTFTNGGTTTQNINLTILDDTLNEADETIIITLSNPTGGTLGAISTLTYTITNDDPLPTVQFTTVSQSIAENAGSILVTAQLSAFSGQTITLPISVNASSTTGGSEYTLSATPLTFPPGVNSVDLTVNIVNDAVYEATETIVLDIGTPTNATASGNLTHTISVTNDDTMPTIQFTAASQSVSEASGLVTVTAQLSSPCGIIVSVPFSINGTSTAIGGTDYTITSSPLSIPVGSTTATITITLTNDTLDELDETIVIDMGTPTNATASGTLTHTATINDDDAQPTVHFTVATQSASEATGLVTVTAQLSAASGLTVDIPFTINGTSTAISGTDYTFTASPLSIPAGSTTADITITLTNDALDELNETIVIDMGTPTNATASGTLTHTATINDDDTPPTVQFTAATQSASEAAGLVTVTAQLSAVSGLAVDIPFTINGTSTAIGGTDYTITVSPITIPAGSTTADITITLINETLYEANETIVLDIGTPTNATASGTLTHTATITNDDTAPNISFTAGTTISVGEAIGNYALSATLSTVSGLPAAVTLNTTDATATGGSDYSAQVSQTLTIPAGSTTATFNIPITNDTLYEGDETFTITFAAAVDSAITGGATQTVTITDNDIGILTAETLDCDSDGKLDHYKLTFTSAVTDSSFPGYALNSVGTTTTDWLIAGYSGVALDHGTSVNTNCAITDTIDDTVLYLKFTEGSGYDTGAKPDLTTTGTPIATGPIGTIIPVSTASVTEADTAKPVIVSITPTNGATSVLLTTNIEPVFSEDMNTGTFVGANFTLTAGAAVGGVVSIISNTSPRFDPTLILTALQAHTVDIMNMADINGNTMSAFSSTFTTAPLNKVLGTVTSGTALGPGLTISNGTSSVNVAAGATSTAYQTASDIVPGALFSVTIVSQPIGQVCSLIDTGANLGGTAGATDITVDVNCVFGYSNSAGVQFLPLLDNRFHLYQGNVSQSVGNTTAGNSDGAGASANFNNPTGITSDSSHLYIADSNNHKIRKVDSVGTVSTFAGNGTAGNSDGTGLISSLSYPRGIATDGTYLYISESASGTGGNRIKRIRIATGATETIAGDNSSVNPAGGYVDGFGIAAKFNEPAGLALSGGILYIAEKLGNRIRKLDLSTKEVTTLSSAGSLNSPEGIVLVGTNLYVANYGAHTILRVDSTSGAQTVFAGTTGSSGNIDAIGTNAKFGNPNGIATDGSFLYVADQGTHYIRQIEIATQKVSTIAGNGTGSSANGVGILAALTTPSYLYANSRSLLFTQAHGVRSITNNGLVAYYPLKANAIDYSNLTFGTINNGAGFTGTNQLGITSQTIVLNGTNQNISSSDTGLPSGSTARTGCAWIKPTLAPNANQTILSYGTGNPNEAFALVLNGNGSSINTIIQSTFGSALSVRFNVQVNLWTHICGVYTGSGAGNISRIYVNGKLVGETTTAAFGTVLGQLRIGNQLNNAEFFYGSISDVRIYSRTLNEGEINELAQNAVLAQVGNSLSTGATGLLVHYPLDSGSNTSSGPIDVGLAGTSGANVTGKDGDTNGGRQFNSLSSHIIKSATTIGLPEGNAPRTICAWASLNQLPPNVGLPGNTYVITNYGSAGNGGTIGIQIVNSGGTHQVGFLGYGTGDVLVNHQSTLNTWTHYCAIYDGANASLYINGKQIIAPTARTISTGTSFFTIGGQNPSTQHFPGKIDDVRVYNNALSEIAIRQLATQVPTGLIARYDFQGDTKDVSGFGVDGSTVGSVTAANDRFGAANSAYSFPGTDGNYIQAVDTFLPKGMLSRTMCMWYRAESGDFAIPFSYGSAGGRSAIWLQTQSIVRLWTEAGDLDANITVLNNIWRHICVIYTGSQGQIYVNGRLILTGFPTVNTGSGNLFMGAWTSGREYGGQLDDMRIYNRALATSEIMALSGYHPMQISNWDPTLATSKLKMHLQADSLSTGTTNVSLWKDGSGNALDISQGTGADQPTFFSSGINGKPVVQFISNKYLTRACTTTTEIGSTNNTIIGAINNSVGAGVHKVLMHHGTKLLYYDGSNNFALFNEVDNNQKIVSSGNFNSLVSTDPNMIFALNHDGTTGALYKNNFNVSGGVIGTGGYNCATALFFGKPSYMGDSFNGYVGEFLYFNATLPVSDRLIVSCYLSAKYGIPLAGGTLCP